jgi:PLP dependent protein
VSIAESLARVQEQIAAAAVRAGRRPEDVTLVGVSKTQPAEVVAEAIRAGLRHVGENRVQEAAAKIPHVATLLQDAAAPCWHLVGHLQTNKAGVALASFQSIDSVDSMRLAEALSRRLTDGHELPILLEVYVGDDPGRPGLRPHEVEDVAGRILDLPGLNVMGLMSVAPFGSTAEATRDAFRQVARIEKRLSVTYPRVHWSVLSMGMSDDFQVAIEEGSTQVRIGTALFGGRTTAPRR